MTAKDEADRWAKVYMDNLKEYMDNAKQFQHDKSFDNIMKIFMLKMMEGATKPVDLYERYSTNVNMKTPIDPDGQVLNLLKEIETAVSELRKLIVSRGRE